MVNDQSNEHTYVMYLLYYCGEHAYILYTLYGVCVWLCEKDRDLEVTGVEWERICDKKSKTFTHTYSAIFKIYILHYYT